MRRTDFGRVLHGLKQHVPEWDKFYVRFPEDLKAYMMEHYALK